MNKTIILYFGIMCLVLGFYLIYFGYFEPKTEEKSVSCEEESRIYISGPSIMYTPEGKIRMIHDGNSYTFFEQEKQGWREEDE